MPGWGEQERWFSSLALRSPQDLVNVGNRYGARFLLTNASPPLPFELIGPVNPSYALYRLPDSSAAITESSGDPAQVGP